MTVFKITDGKSYTIFTEDAGNYYKQHCVYWEKGGYCIPQTRKKIKKAEYDMFRNETKKYRDLNTGETWTHYEIRQAYIQLYELHDKFPTFEDYMEHALYLGRQGQGGIVEVEE